MFNPDFKPAIYSGSKIWHNRKWVEMRDVYGFNVVAHWINFECGTKDNVLGAKQFTPEEKSTLWDRCVEDIRISDMCIFYGEMDDEQRGALVELGAGLYGGKPTYIIGDCPSFVPNKHSDAAYMHHPLMKRVHTTKFANGSYDYKAGYQEAVNHYLQHYHTPERFFHNSKLLNANSTTSGRNLYKPTAKIAA